VNAHSSRTVQLSVVVPLFNEHENVPELYRRLTDCLKSLALDYEIVFVNDGSYDATPALMDSLQLRDSCVVPLHLTRNFGHQAAVCAGLDFARGQAVVVMDGDLQDPPEAIETFLLKWRQGYEVVYAIRTARQENVFKRAAYFLFYRLLRAISDLDIPLDSGDFCLMDRQVVDVLKHLPERVRFVRGLRTFVGFRQIGVPYRRGGRRAGQPKYTFRSLFRLAVDGLVSFSNYPLNLVMYLGFLTAAMTVLVSLVMLLDADGKWLASRGWASAIIIILFTSTVQLISLGIIGEYIRRIFLETKGRPTYIVRDPVNSTSPRKRVRRRKRSGSGV
jgi:dolichol-phosphate mannosyltransferase